MKKIALSILFFIFKELLVFCVAYQPTDPFIVNYDPADYNGSLQNWEAIQDKRGIIFFGNSSGILEFDGINWRRIATPQEGLARGLAIDEQGRIFFGTIGDFGYLKADEQGKISTVSLLEAVPESERVFNDVWQVVAGRNGVYFLTREKIFRYFKNRIEIIRGNFASSQACLLNDILFYIDRVNGLTMVAGNNMHPLIPLRKLYTGQRICLAPYDKHKLLLARRDGDLFILDLEPFWNEQTKVYEIPETLSPDLEKQILKRLSTAFDDFIKGENAYLYKLYNFDNQLFGIATVKGGVIFFNRQGKLIRHLRKEDGLLDNTVAAMFMDRQKNIWCCTNSGISYLLWSSNQSYFSEKNGISGVSISFRQEENLFYCGTFTGLYVADWNNISEREILQGERRFFKPVKNSPPEIWQFIKIDGQLMAATSSGLYLLKKDQAEKIPGPSRDCYAVGTSPLFKNYLFVGMMGGLDVYEKTSSGWKYYKRIEKVKENIRRIVADNNGHLLLSTEKDGIYHLIFQDDRLVNLSLKRLGKSEGLPEEYALSAVRFENQIYLLTPKGIFRFKEKDNNSEQIEIAPDETLGSFFNSPARSVSFLIEDGRGGVIVGADERIFWLKKEPSGKYVPDFTAFSNIPPLMSESYVDNKGYVWVSGKNHLRIELKDRKASQTVFDVLFRSIRVAEREVFYGTFCADKKGMIFSAQQSNLQAATFPFSQNSIRFEFSATFYEKPNQTQYQYMLEGYEDSWSQWQKISSKEYTNLSEGHYRFRIRAKNLFDQISRESFWEFEIKPPWYRTFWAYIIWGISFILFIFGMVRLFTWRLHKRKLILEKLVAEKTRQLKELSLTDPLTGLRNRRFISEVLQNDIQAFVGLKKYLLEARDKRRRDLKNVVFGVFMFDLDHFKEINNHFGHDAGDLLLKQFADLLKSSVRLDDVVIRTGGEEFLVVLKKSELTYLHQFALRILQKVNETEFDLGVAKVKRSCSIGYTSFPVYKVKPDLLTFEQTISIADQALIYAKTHGRNQAVYIEAVNLPPEADEILRKTVANLNYARNNAYLKISNQIKF